MSRIWLPDCSKLARNWKNDNEITICWHDVIINFFVKFSYWSKFHVNIITGSEVMTIFFYKGLTRNPETGNTPVWVFPISGDWGEYGIPNLARMSLVKCYWIPQNARVTAFTVSALLRENQQGVGRGLKLHPPPRLRLKHLLFFWDMRM